MNAYTWSLEEYVPTFYNSKQLLRLIEDSLFRGIAVGVWLGFSVEAMVGFIRRLEAIEAAINEHGDDALDTDDFEKYLPKGINTAYKTPFDGTGYIPTPTDIKKGLTAVKREIEQRRFDPTPFPQQLSDLSKEINHAIKNNGKYRDRLNWAINAAYELHPAPFDLYQKQNR